jgi:hypothetical protein
MFLNLLANAEIVDGRYPGGSSLSNPVPESVAFYASPYGYGAMALVFFILVVFAITRLNVDR